MPDYVEHITIDGSDKTVRDPNAYNLVSKTRKGLCPQLPNESTTTKYLRQDGTWVVPPNTTYGVVSKTTNGLCPQLPNESTTTKYLRQDGTWVVPPNTTYSNFTRSSNGLCPQAPSGSGTTKYLREDGTWVVPPNTTYNVVSNTTNGLCPQLPNESTTTKYLRQDGTWVVPPNTITGTTYAVDNIPNNTTFGTNGTIRNVFNKLKELLTFNTSTSCLVKYQQQFSITVPANSTQLKAVSVNIADNSYQVISASEFTFNVNGLVLEEMYVSGTNTVQIKVRNLTNNSITASASFVWGMAGKISY